MNWLERFRPRKQEGDSGLSLEQQAIVTALSKEAGKRTGQNGKGPELWLDPKGADALLVLERGDGGTVACVRVTEGTVTFSTLTTSDCWKDVIRVRGFKPEMTLSDRVAFAVSNAGKIPDPKLTQGWRNMPIQPLR